MYHTHSSLSFWSTLDRPDKCDHSSERIPEKLFINSLRKKYKFTPAKIAGVLKVAKVCLFGKLPHILGFLIFSSALKKAKHVIPLSEQDMVRVTLALNHGIQDLEILKGYG